MAMMKHLPLERQLRLLEDVMRNTTPATPFTSILDMWEDCIKKEMIREERKRLGDA